MINDSSRNRVIYGISVCVCHSRRNISTEFDKNRFVCVFSLSFLFHLIHRNCKHWFDRGFSSHFLMWFEFTRNEDGLNDEIVSFECFQYGYFSHAWEAIIGTSHSPRCCFHRGFSFSFYFHRKIYWFTAIRCMILSISKIMDRYKRNWVEVFHNKRLDRDLIIRRYRVWRANNECFCVAWMSAEMPDDKWDLVIKRYVWILSIGPPTRRWRSFGRLLAFDIVSIFICIRVGHNGDNLNRIVKFTIDFSFHFFRFIQMALFVHVQL